MARIILLGDTHVGVRNASPILCDYQIKFFKELLFPYMKKNGLTTIFQTGDVFDTRKFSNHFIIDKWKRDVFDYMQENNIIFHCIIGNHDALYKNTLSVNSPTLFLSSYKNVIVHSTPEDIDFDGTSILALPWICQDNQAESYDKIRTSKSPIVIGHLELAKFEMYRGQLCEYGMDHTLFEKYEHVFSGHFHHKSDYGNIAYLGCPYEFTWIDYNDPRGFHVFDTKTYKNKFVQNKDTLFRKVEYNDKDKDSSYWKSFDMALYKDKYVKLVVVNKTDIIQFDMLVASFYASGAADFKIVEDLIEDDVEIDDEIETEASIDLVDLYIDAFNFDGDKVKLKTMMKSLYVEALATLE